MSTETASGLAFDQPTTWCERCRSYHPASTNHVVDQANFALLYLDDLTLAEFDYRKDVEAAKAGAVELLRPFVFLRWRERAGRKIWMPQETHYLSNT